MSVGVRWAALGAAVLLVVLLAIGVWRGAGDARLVDVTGIERQVLERGDTLAILGSGFHAGRQAEVRLRGVMRRPGAPAQALSATLQATAMSGERVEALLDSAAYAQLGQRGSFDGSLEVRFAAARGGRAVSGRAPSVQLDVLPAASATAEDQRLRERAQQLLDTVGIAPADADTLHGLSIARVNAGGLAERAGLHVGDVIFAASGVRVHALSDLAPSVRSAVIELQVKRPGFGTPFPITLGVTAKAAGLAAALDARMIMLSCFVLLVLMFGVPLWSPTLQLMRVVASLRGVAVADHAAAADAQRGRRVLGGVVAVGACAVLPPLMASGGRALDAVCLLALGLALSWDKQLRAPRELGALLASLGVAALVVAAACVSSGSSDLGVLVAQQGAAPWAWKAFSHPELLFGLVLYVACAGKLLERARSRRGEALLRALLALIAAVVFCGGYALPDAPISAFSRFALGTCVLAPKLAAFMWLLPRAHVLASRSVTRSALGLITVVAGTGAWLCVEQPRALEAALGMIVFTTVVLAGGIAVLQARSERKRAFRTQHVAHA